MTFDPDKFLTSKQFDPDEFLKSRGASSEFDPDDFLKSRNALEKEPSTWGDYARLLGKGALGLGRSALEFSGQMVTGGFMPGGPLQELRSAAMEVLDAKLQPIEESLQKGFSPQARARQETLGQKLEEGFVPAAQAVLENPQQMLDLAVQTAPSMVGAIGVGLRGGMGGLAAFSAVTSGGDAAGEVRRAISTADEEDLAESTRYQEYRSSGLTHEQARQRLADDAAKIAIGIAGSISAAATGLTRGGVEGQIIKGTLNKFGLMTLAKGTVKGAIKEPIEESIQSGGEQLGQNIGQLLANPKQLVLEKVPGAMGLGAAAALLPGATGGAISTGVRGSKGKIPEIEARLDRLDAQIEPLNIVPEIVPKPINKRAMSPDEAAEALRKPQKQRVSSLLELASEETYPRPKMAETMPEADFMLRQEVLQQPAIAEAVNAFREAHRLALEAGDLDAVRAIEKEFLAGMKMMGIRNARDAIGLQPLYESGGKLRYPRGIRKVVGPGTKYAKTTEGALYSPLDKDLKATTPKKTPRTRTEIPPVAMMAEQNSTATADKTGQEWIVTAKQETFGVNQDVESLLVEARSPTGELIGFVDFAIDENGVLRSENTVVKEQYKRRGIAEMLYRNARAQGYDIGPGRVQTQEGDQLVRSLIRKNIINVYDKAIWGDALGAIYTDTAKIVGRIGKTQNPDLRPYLQNLDNSFVGDLLGAKKISEEFYSLGIVPFMKFFGNLARLSPDFRLIWLDIEQIFNENPDLVPRLFVNPSKQYVYFNNKGKKRANAYYSPVANAIYLGSSGMNIRTFLHEVIHALTYKYMLARPDDPRVVKLRGFVALLNEDPKIAKHYGASNEYELVSEIFTSSELQQDILSTKNPRIISLVQGVKNGFEAFVNLVTDVLGIKSSVTAKGLLALSEIMATSKEIINKYIAEKEAVNREFEEKLKTSQNLGSVIDDAAHMDINSVEKENLGSKEQIKYRLFDSTPIGEKLELIPKDPDPIQIIELAKKTKEVSDANLVIGGKTMVAEIKNNPIISATRDYLLNATKRANLNIREFVKPTEKAVNRVLQDPNKGRLLSSIFHRELRRETPYTLEELRNAEVPASVVEAYVAFREMMDRAWAAQNSVRVAAGLPELSKLDYYISSRWQGPWRTPVYNKDGKLVFYIAEETKARAKAALKYLAEREPSIDIKRSKIEFRNQQTKPGAEPGYQAMLQILDKDDPRVAVLKSIYEEYITVTGEDVLGQPKHFKEKTGVGGFVGARPWADQNGDIRDMFRQQFQYAKNAFEWAELQKATNNLKTILADTDLQETHNKTLGLVRELYANHVGMGEMEWMRGLEGSLAKATGISPHLLAQAVGYARTYFYITKLGMFNLPYTVVNIVQPLYTLPWHARLSDSGYSHNVFKTFGRGMHDALALYFRTDTFGIDTDFTEIGAKAADYALINGLIDINAMSDVADVGRPDSIQAVEKVVTFNMVEAEKLARSVAFMSFVHHLEQSGKFTNELDLFKRAEELTNLSMVDYRISERAQVFNKLGILGSALSTLQTFKINQLNQLYLFYKDAVKGNPRPLATMLLLHLFLAGALGMFAVDTADDIWEFLKSNMPDEMYAQFRETSPRRFILEYMPDLLAYGGASKLTGYIPGVPESGINLSSRFDAGPILDISMQGLLPFVTDLWTQGAEVSDFLLSPKDPVERSQALYAIAPASLKGLVETSSDVFSHGGLAGRISKPSEGVYRRSPEETAIRKFGLMSVDEAREKERVFRNSKIHTDTEKRLRALSQTIVNNILFGTEEIMAKNMMTYVRLGGDLETLFNNMDEVVLNKYTTKLERIKMKAGTNRGLREFLLYNGLE